MQIFCSAVHCFAVYHPFPRNTNVIVYLNGVSGQKAINFKVLVAIQSLCYDQLHDQLHNLMVEITSEGEQQNYGKITLGELTLHSK